MTEDTKDFLVFACLRFPLDFQCIVVVVLIIIIIIIIIIVIIIIIILLLLLLLTTSFGEQCRGPNFQQQRNHHVYYEVTSVQTVSRLYRGSKVNVLHEM